MSSTLDRLRRLQGLREQKKVRAPEPSARPAHLPVGAMGGTVVSDAAQSATIPLVEVVDGEVIENHAGTCFVSTRRYSLETTHGPRELGALLEQEPALFAPFQPKFNLDRARDYMDAAFIDTETTGLGGGAGVYAFMVGVGTFEIPYAAQEPQSTASRVTAPAAQSAPQFVVRQFFMRTPAEEGALLVALADLLSGYELTVTFNGRTFDLPLLRARVQMNHWLFPGGVEDVGLLASDRAHLDLLLPARKLWKRRLRSCRLISLEENILGLHRDETDVPGYLIPQLYSDYVRSGDATTMANIFYHNREDIVSMVALAETLGRAYSRTPGGNQADDLHGAEWLGLGLAYEQLDEADRAEAAYRLIIEGTLETGSRAEAFVRLGQMLKRQQRWREASEIWQQWLTSIDDNDPTPYVELAKYCEWRIKDLEQAEMWTGWAVHNLRAEPVWQQNRTLLAELEHRLARIQRKRSQ